MTTKELALRWAVAFTITQVVECALYIRIFRVRPWVAFMASVITHPFVTLALPWMWERLPLGALSPRASFVAYGAVAETLAVVVEACWLVWIARMTWKHAGLASVAANVCSSTAGGLCFLLTGWP